MSILPFTYTWLIKRNIKKFKIKTILELGCGKGAFGELINDKGEYRITGVDIFEPYLKICKGGGKYEKVLKRNITKKLPFKDRSFDAAVCLQTIEHLSKESGALLIEEMERVARTVVLISIPNGQCDQEEYDNNKYQRHLSEWVPQEFKGKGYSVRGTGLKLVYGSHSHAGDEVGITKLPLYFISFIMNPLVFNNLNLAAQLVAVKVKNER